MFAEFQKLQKKPNEAFLEFYWRASNFYEWTMDDSSQMGEDKTAFRMIKEKMVNAYPSRYVPDFKRRLENKEQLGDIFDAIVEMTQNYPDIGNDGGNDGNELYALRKKNDDWQKNAKCFACGKKGHIKRNCYSR